MKIGLFCSANDHIDRRYFDETERLGRWMAAQGHTLVFGGCDSGLMECAARAVQEGGGRTIGVIPTIVERGGRVSPHVDIEIPCDNLSDRKDLMMAQADVFVALPGGIGTLDEVFTVAASHTIGYHHKRVILFNTGGCWDALTALLDDLQRRGMIRGDWRDTIAVATTIDELQRMVGEAAAGHQE